MGQFRTVLSSLHIKIEITLLHWLLRALQAHCRITIDGITIDGLSFRLGRVVSYICVTFLDEEGREMGVQGAPGSR